MAHTELLAGTDLFAAWGRDAVERIAREAESIALTRNDEVFRQGDAPDALYVVEGGRIAMTSSAGDGRETLLALMDEGDLFGELGLFDNELGRTATARALELSTLVKVPYSPVVAIFEEQPALLWGVTRLIARRLRATDAALSDSVFLDVPGRTAKRILELAGGRDDFQLPLTQEELAGMVGASRERVNKAISQFVRLGWLAQSDRRYRILDREQLTRRAT